MKKMYQLMEDYPSPAEGNGLENRQAVSRVRIPYGLFFMEDYPSPAEGNGLENRQACKSAQGFESLILL